MYPSLLGLLPGAFLGGLLADRIGRKRVLTAAVALFGLFSLLTAQSRSLHSLLAARFMTGLGLGAALPNLNALTSDFDLDAIGHHWPRFIGLLVNHDNHMIEPGYRQRDSGRDEAVSVGSTVGASQNAGVTLRVAGRGRKGNRGDERTSPAAGLPDTRRGVSSQ